MFETGPGLVVRQGDEPLKCPDLFCSAARNGSENRCPPNGRLFGHPQRVVQPLTRADGQLASALHPDSNHVDMLPLVKPTIPVVLLDVRRDQRERRRRLPCSVDRQSGDAGTGSSEPDKTSSASMSPLAGRLHRRRRPRRTRRPARPRRGPCGRPRGGALAPRMTLLNTVRRAISTFTGCTRAFFKAWPGLMGQPRRSTSSRPVALARTAGRDWSVAEAAASTRSAAPPRRQ